MPELFDVYARRRGAPRVGLVHAAVPFESLASIMLRLEREDYCEASVLPAEDRSR